MHGQPTVSAASEVDFSKLGPATRLAIKVALNACDDGIREAEEKLALRTLRGTDRRHWETELHGWKVCRNQLLTQEYPLPYRPGTSQREPDPGLESPAST